MQVENLANLSHKIDLEPDEAVLLHIFIAGLNEPKCQTINDLFAVLIDHCCQHCTDHLEDPCDTLTEEQARLKDYADRLNCKGPYAVSQN